MSYEQLQALGEAVGNESRGLSDDLICYLVPFKNKCSFFSRKKNDEEYVPACPVCNEELSKVVKLKLT
uniref:Uncharacterized protein n=1 Tax=Oryza punctata TaxID=4537 RepID=A0A0E0M3L1_ORYPU